MAVVAQSPRHIAGSLRVVFDQQDSHRRLFCSNAIGRVGWRTGHVRNYGDLLLRGRGVFADGGALLPNHKVAANFPQSVALTMHLLSDAAEGHVLERIRPTIRFFIVSSVVFPSMFASVVCTPALAGQPLETETARLPEQGHGNVQLPVEFQTSKAGQERSEER